MPQSKYLLNMSYCRLKSLTLGYSLPTNLIRKVYLNKVRVYVSGENLFTIDKLGDIPLDPEPTLLPATVVHKDSVVFIRT